MAVAKVFNQDRDNIMELSEVFVNSKATDGKEKQVRGIKVGITGYDPDDCEVLGRYKSKDRAIDVLKNMVHIMDQKPEIIYSMPKE